MNVQSFNCYNETNSLMINPINPIQQTFKTTEIFLRKLKEVHPKIIPQFVEKLTHKLVEYIESSSHEINISELIPLLKDYEFLQDYSELVLTIFKFVAQTLILPPDYSLSDEEMTLRYFDIFKSYEQLSYFRVKILFELLGKSLALEIYNKIVPDLIVTRKKAPSTTKSNDPHLITLTERHENNIQSWCRMGLVDFTAVIFDEYKVLYRFDRCTIHEVLKAFADPDIAYLCSCYLGDSPSYNDGEIIYMRRTQTLHHAKFCDELYWNNVVYPNVEQPSLSFTEQLRK